MAFEVETTAGEKVLLDVRYRASEKSAPFALGITDRAIFLPAKKTFTFTEDPHYFQRVPIEEVREVRIRRIHPTFLYLLSPLMIGVGIYFTIWMFTPGNDTMHGYPLAILIGGLVLPFAARGRFGLVVTMRDRKFRWKPPLVVDRASKEYIAGLLNSIAAAAEKAHIYVADERRVA